MDICNMACLQENNIEQKRLEKRTNYRQFAFEIREREDLDSKVVPLVISAFGGGINPIQDGGDAKSPHLPVFLL